MTHSSAIGCEADRTLVPQRRRGLVLLVMCVGMFLVQLDVTVVNVALPAIGIELRADLPGLQWVVDAYAILLTAFLLAGGVAGDRYGHKQVVTAGLAVFGLASIGCALAPTNEFLIAGRAVQGIGAAMLLSCTLAVVIRAFPERGEQARAIGIWVGASALALPAGPLIGGVLVTTLGWQSVFWVNVPIVAAALIAIPQLLRTAPSTTARRIDIAGPTLAAIALAAIVYTVLSYGHTSHNLGIGLTATITVLAGGAFLLVEHKMVDPMLPLKLFRSKAFVGANTIAAVMNFVGIGVIFVTTMYLQGLQGRTALLAGAQLVPLFVPLALLAPFAGRVVSRYGPRPPILAGLALGALGALGFLLLTPSSSYLRLLPALLGIGMGIGLLAAAVVAAAIRAVPPDQAGLASAVNNTARQAAGALGIAAFGTIAGTPTAPNAFIHGLHALGVLSAVLWAAALLLTLATIASTRSRPAAEADD